jgi:rubrerythrin
MIRGTSEPEKMLKNAKTEFQSEAEEIGTYTSIATLAKVVGDRDTEQLANAILREEKRMAGFLEKLIPRLTQAVAKAEIPPSQRNGARRTTRRRTTARSSGSRTTARSSTSRSRSGSSPSTASRSRSSSRSGSTRSGGSSRSGAARRTSARRTASSGARSK